MIKTLFTPLLLTATLFAQEIPQDVIDTGEKASSELLKNLGSKLKHEIKTNGIISAVRFCNTNALTLTEEVNLHQVKGVSIKRISLKERNPANTPSADEANALQKMQALLDTQKLSTHYVEETDNAYKYYKPLVITKEVCLKCHGDINKNPKLADFIKESYPEDKATGYKMGDLRGAILVEIQK